MKKMALIALRLCLNSNYRLLRKLRIFDSGYYLVQAGKGEVTLLDPLWDYLYGVEAKSDVEFLAGAGWRQLGDPHPLFDTSFYLHRYYSSTGDHCQVNPFVHYLKKGWKEGFEPGPFFDSSVYEEESSWQQSDGNPLVHYTYHGMAKGVKSSRSFDIDYYLDNNPILFSVKHEIIKHYKLHGAKIGKSPLPVFEPQYYLDQLDDSSFALADPLSHYLTMEKAGHKPGQWFDPDFYANQFKLKPDHESALMHYLLEGVHEARTTDKRVLELALRPVISIVVPVYNPDLKFLANCIRSVLYQAYPHWEICLADDCSSQPGVREMLQSWAERDSRIKLSFLSPNGGIAAATNEAISLSTGDYIGFLDNDDELSVDCLYHIAKCINDTKAELIYTDEDLIGDDGSRLSIFRKPGFNGQLLLSHNYITHFLVAKKDIIGEVGGLRSEFDGAQDFDLMLRLSEKTKNIQHLPLILYHWRASETSTSINHGEKSYAHEAGRAALEAALVRRDLALEAVDTDINYFYHCTPKEEQCSAVTVLLWIPEQNSATGKAMLSLLSRTEYVKVHFIVVTKDQDANDWLAENGIVTGKVTGDFSEKVSVYYPPIGTEKTEALQMAVVASATISEFIAFLDLPDGKLLIGDEFKGDWINKDWLEQLLGPFCFEDTGISCGRVRYAGGDGPSYSLPDLTNSTPHYYCDFLNNHSRHANGAHCPQEIPTCGWGLALIRRKLFLEMGGFDSSFPVLFGLMDLAMSVAEGGAKIRYTPSATIDLGESAVEPVESVPHSSGIETEQVAFQVKWQTRLSAGGAFYNLQALEDNGIDSETFLAWLSGR